MIKRMLDPLASLFRKRGEANYPPQNMHEMERFQNADPDASLIRFWDEDAGGAVCQIVLTDVLAIGRSWRGVIETSVLIGFSSEMDICVNHDKSVSRKHCEILREGDLFYIVNHSRSNGTYLNHQMVLDKAPIADGDIITMGRVEVCMEIDG